MATDPKSWWSKDNLVRRLPEGLKPLAQSIYRRFLTAVEYHRHQKLLLANRDFRGRHAERRRCFVIANGPSIKSQDLTPLADEMTIAVNSFHYHPHYGQIAPKYHIVVDPLHVTDVPNSVAWLREVDRVETPTVFVLPVEGKALLEKYNLFNGKTVRFVLLSDQRCGTGKVKCDFTRPVSGVQCVSVGAILLACFLGFREIYLLGCDHDWLAHPTADVHFYEGTPHFVDNMASTPYDAHMVTMLELWREYREVRKFATERGIQIYNATRGGFLDVFPRVSYEKLVEKNLQRASSAVP